MFRKQLNKLNESFLQLKELSKCPICLDSIEDLVELECLHRYCSQCFTSHKSTQKQVSCPLCKTIVKRRSTLYKDEIANILGKFVNKVSEHVNTVCSSDVHCVIDDVSKIVESIHCEDGTNKGHANSSINIPTTSKGRGDMAKKHNDSAFDKLLKPTQCSLVFNRKGTKTTYTRTSKQKVAKEEVGYKILHFLDDQNKVNVLKWLNDTRNHFDRLTQTQNIVEEDIAASITQHDLPSVSQAAKLRNVDIVPRRLRYKGRAKSLDIDIKKMNNRKKRCSDGVSYLVDNYEIEETNTEEEKVVEKAEENVLLNLIEDGYLNKLETEFQNYEKAKVKPSNCTKVENSTPKCTKGWDRLSEIKKTMDKGDKVHKQLNITLQGSQNSSVKKLPSPEEKFNKFNLMLSTYVANIKGGFNSPNNQNNSVNKVPEIVNNPQDTNKKSKMIPRKRTSSNNDKAVQDTINLKKNKSPLVKLPVTLKQKVMDDKTKMYQGKSPLLDSATTKEQCVGHIGKSEKPKSPLPKSEVVRKVANSKSYDLNTLEDYLLKNMLAIQNSDKTMANTYDGKTDKTTLNQKPNKNKIPSPRTVCTDVRDISETAALKTPTEDPFLDDDYIKPTQKLNTSTNDQASSHNPAQELSFDDHYLQNLDSFEDLLNVFDGSVQKCLDFSNNVYVKAELHKLKICFNKIRTLNGENITKSSKSIVSFATVDAAVQCSIPTRDIQAQTELVESRSTAVQTKITFEDTAVQTDDKSSKTTETQTETYTCMKCSGNTNNRNQDDQESLSQNTKLAMKTFLEEPLTESNGIPSNKRTQMFSATLDNFNFETQEISDRKQKIPDNEIDQIPMSVLVCTVDQSSGDKVSRKLVYEKAQADVSKRSRQEDSDDEICPPVKRNRFIRNDLSVEFETQMTKKPDDRVSMLGADSDSIDYDKYLAEVMKKHDEGNLFSDTFKSEGTVDKSVEQPVLDCDDIAAAVNKNIEALSKVKKTMNSSSSDSFKTASPDDLEKDIEYIMKMCDNQSEQVNTESTDIIGKTESMEPLPKRLKTGKRNVVVEKPEACDELIDNLDDAHLEFSQPKIHILCNVKLKSQDKQEEEQNENDLFSDDDDIVQTTPQKEKRFEKINLTNISLLSQFKNAFEENNDFVDLDFDPLPPPPDFQDTLETDCNLNVSESKEDVTIIDVNCTKHFTQKTNKETSENVNRSQQFQRVNISSLTPDDLSPYIKSEKMIVDQTPGKLAKRQPKTPEKRDDPSQLTHITPLSIRRCGAETLGFSPITADRSVTEAHTSRRSSNKRNILTSTPKQKSIWNYVRTSQSHSPPPKPKPCIACTRLNKDQIMAISQLTNKKLATYSVTFDASVTHMIVSVDQNNCLKDYTIKSMAAIAAGIWVLRFGWIQECLNSNSIVDEESYEVFDDTGQPGPRTSRLTRSENPLLGGYKFYCADPFFSTTRKDLEDIIKMLGGKLVPNPESLTDNDGRIGLIITEGRATQDFEIYENWLEMYKTVTVDIEWLSKSVARYKLLSIRPYVWCTDDCLDDLNYPAYLIEYVALTVSET